MIAAPLPVRRRNSVERKVLDMMRGDDAAADDFQCARGSKASPTPPHQIYSGKLRRIAQRRGLVIRPSRSPYLNYYKMLILSWLAGGQRVASDSRFPDDLTLNGAIARCAGMLEGIRLKLSSLTLYGA